MNNAQNFFRAVGLTNPILAWLRQNPGDRLREDAIKALMDAFEENCPPSHLSTIRFLFIQIDRKIKSVDENEFLV